MWVYIIYVRLRLRPIYIQSIRERAQPLFEDEYRLQNQLVNNTTTYYVLFAPNKVSHPAPTDLEVVRCIFTICVLSWIFFFFHICDPDAWLDLFYS